MSEKYSIPDSGIEEELYDACLSTMQQFYETPDSVPAIGQALNRFESLGPGMRKQRRAISLVHDEELDPIRDASIGMLADIGITLKALSSAYDMRSGKGADIGRGRLAELLERDEVKSKMMDVPSYLTAGTEGQEAYIELVRAGANELGMLTYTLSELSSGFSVQLQTATQLKYTIRTQHREENLTRSSTGLIEERRDGGRPDYAWVRKRENRLGSPSRRRRSPKRFVGVKETVF